MEYLHALTGPQAYLILCTLIFIEECGIPLPFLPGDVLLMAGGYLAAIHVVNLAVFVVVVSASAFLGAWTCFTVSRRLGRPLVIRYGPYVGVTERRLAAAERWLDRAGTRAVVVARILPGTRINTSIAAGCLTLARDRFARGVLLSTPVWVCTFTVAGARIGDAVTPLLPLFDRAIMAGALCLLGGGALWLALRPASARS